jgi:hypothetical protein
VSGATLAPASERLGFGDPVGRLAAQAPARDTERALDRHWRNLKVLAAHNPSTYKQQVLGGYEVHGTRPPLSIYF